MLILLPGDEGASHPDRDPSHPRDRRQDGTAAIRRHDAVGDIDDRLEDWIRNNWIIFPDEPRGDRNSSDLVAMRLRCTHAINLSDDTRCAQTLQAIVEFGWS